MRIDVGTNYSDFKTVVTGVGGTPSHIFYGKSGSDVVNALVLYPLTKNVYILMNIGPGIVTETTFLTDFPSATNATTSAAY